LFASRPPPTPNPFPIFSIIPRGSSGVDAACASQSLVERRYSPSPSPLKI
jgi:hypothetical protein